MASGKHTRTWVDTDGGTPVSYEKTVTGELGIKLTRTIAAGVTDLAITCPIDFSALESLFVGTNQDLLIETNNAASGSADDSWDLKANQAIDWQTGDVMANPLTADVTVIFVTNSGASDADLELRTTVDATP